MTDKTPSSGDIIKPELCSLYKEKLLSLPDKIYPASLNSIVGSLFACFYTQILQEVSDVAIKKDQVLNMTKRERIRSLLEKARKTKEETVLKNLFSQCTKEGYQIKIVKPGSSPKKLGEDLAAIKNCWISSPSDLKWESTMNKVKWLQKDIDLGACVYLISEEIEKSMLGIKKNVPKVQTRAYIANTRRGETILFYDAIEGGSIGWSSIEDWTCGERGRELLYSIAGIIYIAKEYGMGKIGIGEREVQELATRLGFKEEMLFNEKYTRGVTEKIGFVGDPYGNSGPYCFGISGGTERRVIPLNEIKMLSKGDIEERLENITNFLSSFKKTRKNKNKMEEVGVYLECLNAVNELNDGRSKEISEKIDLLQEKYFIKE